MQRSESILSVRLVTSLIPSDLLLLSETINIVLITILILVNSDITTFLKSFYPVQKIDNLVDLVYYIFRYTTSFF